MLVVLRNVNAQVTVGERWVVKQLFVVTDSTIVCGKDLLRKIELYLTLVNAVWRRNGLRSRPTVFKSVQYQLVVLLPFWRIWT